MSTVISNIGYPTYDSVATMKGINLPAGYSVRTHAYYGGWAALTVKPTGGTTYDIISAADFTGITGFSNPDGYGDHLLDNGNIAMLSVRAVKNVLEFGAKGDDSNDDTLAIAAAYASAKKDGGNKVYLPTGTYLVTPSTDNLLWTNATTNRKTYAVFLVGDHIVTAGDGASTIMKLSGTIADSGPTDGRGLWATSIFIANEDAPTEPKLLVGRDIEIINLTFDGNNVLESGTGVVLAGVINFSIRNVFFKNTVYECTYLTYCRGGEFANNFTNKCGEEGALSEGGGPFADHCVNVNIHYNIFTDSGYHAVRMENSWECVIKNNMIKNEEYTYSTTKEAIYGKLNADVKYVNNNVVSSKFSGLRDYQGFNNLIQSNTVLDCGKGATGAAIHGIVIDDISGSELGRITITENVSIYNEGHGIYAPGKVVDGDNTFANAGYIISANTTMYNKLHGISVYGDNFRIQGNTVEANGISGTTYNGIMLNGSKYCVVDSNSCQDITQAAAVNLNLDGLLGIANRTVPVIEVTHTSRTQYYGIQESAYGMSMRSVALTSSGTTVTATLVGHGLTASQVVYITGANEVDYNGYVTIATIADVDTFTYTVGTAPSASPATGTITASTEVLISDYNIVTSNSIMNNAVNPGTTVPVAGGYDAQSSGSAVSGINSTVANNLGE